MSRGRAGTGGTGSPPLSYRPRPLVTEPGDCDLDLKVRSVMELVLSCRERARGGGGGGGECDKESGVRLRPDGVSDALR